jgi:hypothetical protein
MTNTLIDQHATASNAEPVAWRRKWPLDKDWTYSDSKPEVVTEKLRVEPLYASPPSVRPVEREKIARAIYDADLAEENKPPVSDETWVKIKRISLSRFAFKAADAILSLPAWPPWQPIETAPKDDTRIQLMRVKSPKFENLPDILWIKIGSWRAHFADGYTEGWREHAVAGPSATDHLKLSPTHWMPLPALPAKPKPDPHGWEIGKNGWDASDEATREDI